MGRGGAGLITSCVLRSHTDAALLYVLLQFHRCVMPPEHIFTWISWVGCGGVLHGFTTHSWPGKNRLFKCRKNSDIVHTLLYFP